MWFLSCGSSCPQGFFAVAFSGYTSAMELLFPSETPQVFQKRSVGFLLPRRMTLPWPNGAGNSREPIAPHQHDEHIHLHLARIPTGDLNNRFALSKTASTILGVRQRHRKDNTFLWWYHSVYLNQYLPDVWRHSTEVDMVVNARRNWLWGQKEKINPEAGGEETRALLCHHFSDQRDVSRAAGHTFWPEGNHSEIIFLSFYIQMPISLGKKK